MLQVEININGVVHRLISEPNPIEPIQCDKCSLFQKCNPYNNLVLRGVVFRLCEIFGGDENSYFDTSE